MSKEHWPKSKILELFRGLGIKFVAVSFEGGGDSGDVGSIKLYRDDPETTEPQMDLLEATGQSIGVDADFSYLSLIDSLSKPVYDKYCGFDNEPFVTGCLMWDITTGELQMEGEESQTVSESFCDEAVDYEPGPGDREYFTGTTFQPDSESQPSHATLDESDGDPELGTESDGAD